VARVDARTRVQPGDSIDLALDTERLHLFDPESQAAIAGPVRTLKWGLELGNLTAGCP
jgi:hypothetical protein